MGASIWIKKITFNDNTTLELAKSDIVVFVGPNNAGKSITLRGLFDLFSNRGSNVAPIVRSIEVQRDGTDEDLAKWIEKNCQESFDHPRTVDNNYVVTKANIRNYLSDIKSNWTSDSTPNLTGDYFACWAAAGNRLEVANAANSIVIHKDPFTHPIHYLYGNDALEEKLCKGFKESFGLDLIVDRVGGSQVPLRCGIRPPLCIGEDRLSHNYLKKIQALPLLHEQGDGMRSFVGCLLLATVVDNSLILVDEPEAFLHPPQARQLGRMLAKDKPFGRQLFLATHSGDFLRGLLSAESSHIRVLRIRRDGSINPIRQLSPDRVQQLWRDPLLRHSHTLDGLFHEKVILCESDSDCRFYGAVMDALFDNAPDQNRPAIMFTHCGGKQRMPVILESLTHLEVPLRVVADFDLLREEQPLRKIFEALGGSWEFVKNDWQFINSTIINMRAELRTSEVRKELSRILDSIEGDSFPELARQSVREIVRKTSAWSSIKTTGRIGLPSGQPIQTLDRLLSHFKAKGLFVVEVGELEGFDRGLGGHGPTWVNSVLEKNLFTASELEGARLFVRTLIL